ncbi:hypothetical protein HY483_01935 [Candidatus Woesearchaeota archaeon]|nr:hypothetical protein [Candidatus Woesearchaeota archaeon]
MKNTLSLNELSKDSAGIAGGKGASLGEMICAGIPVPHGFVVSSGVFESFIDETGILEDIDSVLHSVNLKSVNSVDRASEKIRSIILSEEIPAGIKKEISSQFKKLGAKFVAVRSSATSEDSSTAAWAGQLDTFLNTTSNSLFDNIKKCWASLFTPRAIFYRFEKNLHDKEISVAVVVQKMIDSDVSGVAFSVHPVTQNKNQLIIEASYGLGESIVSGQITPDSFVVEKNSFFVLNRNISTKSRELFKSKIGGVIWKNITKDRQNLPSLSDTEVLELSKLIVKIENHYGFPCDIEWALSKGKFYILQSRPITTLN